MYAAGSMPAPVSAMTSLTKRPGTAPWGSASAAESVAFSTWYRIGPFAAGSFDQAHAKEFVDAADVDLEKARFDVEEDATGPCSLRAVVSGPAFRESEAVDGVAPGAAEVVLRLR